MRVNRPPLFYSTPRQSDSFRAPTFRERAEGWTSAAEQEMPRAVKRSSQCPTGYEEGYYTRSCRAAIRRQIPRIIDAARNRANRVGCPVPYRSIPAKRETLVPFISNSVEASNGDRDTNSNHRTRRRLESSSNCEKQGSTQRSHIQVCEQPNPEFRLDLADWGEMIGAKAMQ